VKNYNLLAMGILRQAVKDYQMALIKKDARRVAYLEKWFVSDWAQLLSNDKGEIIVKMCRERSAAWALEKRPTLLNTPTRKAGQ
jgi:hypothetical protein